MNKSICKIKVKKVVISEEFKPNSAAITVGFLFRKGLLTPDESSLVLFLLRIILNYFLNYFLF